MARPEYSDSPPSYAEATAGGSGDGRGRRSTAGLSRTAAPGCAYFHRGEGPATTTTTTTTTTRIFPSSFSMYPQGPRRCVLAEDRDRPLYAVTTTSSLASRPGLAVHSDVSEDAPLLAYVDHAPQPSRCASISLPPPPGSRRHATSELLEPIGALARVMAFGIHTLPPPPPPRTTDNAVGRSSGRRESFEWRHSSGVEVEALGGRHSGWKLVRLVNTTGATTTTTTSGKNNKTKARAKNSDRASATDDHNNAPSSGGREVVAVWAAGPGLFAPEVLRFRFLGAGANGSLGERWAVMAVASALAVWHRDRRARLRGLAAASV
ncbi:hypothetical protein F4802DRAFT_618957 [Xylaria palmicola]|nr:hypothetical protein F4802DRAFT_618957 [Xylaria palmicola]